MPRDPADTIDQAREAAELNPAQWAQPTHQNAEPGRIAARAPGAQMTDTDRFELFSFWRTSATYRVRVAFRLKGVAPHEHFVNVDAGELRDPTGRLRDDRRGERTAAEHRRLQPLGLARV